MNSERGNSRPGIEAKTAGIAVVVVLVVAGIAAFFFLPTPNAAPASSSLAQISVPSSSIATSSATGSQVGGLDITQLIGDVDSGGAQAPFSNSTSYGDGPTYKGDAGQSFTVQYHIIWQLCGGTCPAQISKVTVSTPGFTILSVYPALPVPAMGQTGVDMVCDFSVTIQPPSTPYTGTLTLVASP